MNHEELQTRLRMAQRVYEIRSRRLAREHAERLARIRQQERWMILAVWLVTVLAWPAGFFLAWLWKYLGWT